MDKICPTDYTNHQFSIVFYNLFLFSVFQHYLIQVQYNYQHIHQVHLNLNLNYNIL